MDKIYTNGFVIQEYKDNTYKGIDGSGFSVDSARNWYLNDSEKYEEQFEHFYDEFIGKTYWNIEPHSWVSVCTDLEYLRRYTEVSKELGIRYRIILVRTNIPAPVLNSDLFGDTMFLGYDYAYIGGDNYSAVYNEIPFVFDNIQLNKNGLIETMDEMLAYISQRDVFVNNHAPYTLEVGDFAIMELYEVSVR